MARPRTHSINDHAFDDLTPDAMYWLGFLFADGSISGETSRKRHSVSLGLATADIAHIESFRAFLGSSHKISTFSNAHGYGCGTLSTLSVDSLILHSRLAQLGMRNKSLDRVAPPECTTSSDFWRGVIDGDGCIKEKTSKSRTRLELVGGETLLNQFAAFVRSLVPQSRSNVILKDKFLFRIQFSSNDARLVVHALYGHGGPSLPRKYAIARTIMSESAIRIRCRDLSGRVFFRLTAMSKVVIQGKRYGRTTGRKAAWLCKCSCGAQCTALESALLAGAKKSCGCYQIEFLRKHGAPYRFKPGREGKYLRDSPQQRSTITGRFISTPASFASVPTI